MDIQAPLEKIPDEIEFLNKITELYWKLIGLIKTAKKGATKILAMILGPRVKHVNCTMFFYLAVCFARNQSKYCPV